MGRPRKNGEETDLDIIVLAGGLSPERQVSLVSGQGICRALRSLGHRAVLVDMFLGLESWEGAWKDIFDAPDGLVPRRRLRPRLPTCRRSAHPGRTGLPAFSAPAYWRFAAMRTRCSWVSMASAARTGASRRLSTCWGSPIPVPDIWVPAWL